MNQRQHLRLIPALSASLLLAACSAGATSTPASSAAAVAPSAAAAASAGAGTKTIFVITQDLTNLLVKAESDGAANEAKKLGYQVVVESHANDPATQLSLFEDAIAKHAAAIIVDNAGADATVTAVQKAKDAGIPTFLIDREMNATGVAMAQIVANNAQGAVLGGQEFARLMGQKGNYVEFTGIETDNNAQIRSKGYHSVLDPLSAMKMVAQQSAHWSQTEAFNDLQTILQSTPDIQGVINGNDTMALGAWAAVKAAGKTNIIVVGFDGNPDVLNSIKAGEIKATVFQPLVKIAQMAADEADAYIRTGQAPATERQLVDCELVTPANVDQYLALFQ